MGGTSLTLPIERGATMPNAGEAVDTDDLVRTDLEGLTAIDEDKDHTTIGYPKLTEEQVHLRLVRNMGNSNILPRQAVLINPASPGRTNTTPLAGNDVSYAVIADPFLPSAGVRPGCLFWVIERGPTTAIAGEGIASGAEIGTVASGKVGDGTATKNLGVALAAASNDADPVRVYLRPRFK